MNSFFPSFGREIRLVYYCYHYVYSEGNNDQWSVKTSEKLKTLAREV